MFTRGNKKRIGRIRRNVFGFSLEALHAVLESLKEYWGRIKSEEQRKDIEDLAVYVIMYYCGRLRGEEVPMISLKGILYFWEEKF